MGVRKYLRLPVPISVDSEALVAEKSLGWLGLAEGVVFDCDGVLVDSRGSYGGAITETVGYILGRLGVKNHSEFVRQGEVDELKATGHFNNSVEVARTLLLLAFLGLPHSEAKRLAEAIRRVGEANPNRAPNILLEEVGSAAQLGAVESNPPSVASVLSRVEVRGSGYTAFRRALDEALNTLASERGLGDDYKVYANFIGEAGSYGVGLAETVFSDVYYGPLVSEFKGAGPYFNLGEGLYRNETRSIREETLKRLSEIYGAERLAVVTGRNRRLAKLVIGSLYTHFNDDASVFIADEIMAGAPLTIQKPSPYGILKSASGMGVPTIIYVGDSAEDIAMAQNASEFGVKTLFVGVTGLASNPTKMRRMFASLGADVIVESVDSLPFIIEEAKRSA
ncbi:MAG: HAD-IA family hydrolase [Thermoprotei archaeon]